MNILLCFICFCVGILIYHFHTQKTAKEQKQAEISFAELNSKLTQLNQEITLKEKAYQDATAQSAVAQSDLDALHTSIGCANNDLNNLVLKSEVQQSYLDQLNETIREKSDFINEGISKLEAAKRNELEANLKNEQTKLELELKNAQEQVEQNVLTIRSKAEEEINEWNEKSAAAKAKYFSIVASLNTVEEGSGKRIELSESDKVDIKYLTEEVVPRLQNKDTIYKLIWQEYYQVPATKLFANILPASDCSGIYKITNLEDKKCYIGRSTNVRRRLTDHIKSAIGIETIANQRVHDVMREKGIWNFSFELLEACEKNELGDREKYYIDFFQSNEPLYGYNVVSGSAFKAAKEE